jgi:hypothetical protein
MWWEGHLEGDWCDSHSVAVRLSHTSRYRWRVETSKLFDKRTRSNTFFETMASLLLTLVKDRSVKQSVSTALKLRYASTNRGVLRHASQVH